MQKDKHAVRLEAIARADLTYSLNEEDPVTYMVEHNRWMGFVDGYEAAYAQAVKDLTPVLG